MSGKRKPKQPNTFFTSDTEQAILEYVASTDQSVRNKVYNTRIHYAFHKLVEILIHNFKFYYTETNTIEELKHEVVCMLLEKLPRYTQSHGKAYSYFYKISLNYLINYNKKNYKKLKEKAPVEEIDNDKTILIDITNNNDKSQNLEKSSAIEFFITHVEDNLHIFFPRSRDAKVVDAILEIFKKRENLDILSKKALYIYIREITDATTPVITSNIKKLKAIYKTVHTQFIEDGQFEEDIF